MKMSCVQERMIHHIWSQVAANDQNLIDTINEYRASQNKTRLLSKFRAYPSHESLTVKRLKSSRKAEEKSSGAMILSRTIVT